MTRRAVLSLFGLAAVAAGFGFGVKLVEFAADLLDQEGLPFAGAHLPVYGLVALGFLLLLVFCFLRGHFGDIERPKYELLEQERRYDLELERRA